MAGGTGSGDGAAAMRVHMMDMGGRRYGDCTLVVVGGRTVLIDGGHKGDERSVEDGGTDLLGQIGAAAGSAGPLTVDLLVVTHAHADHVGCLPELVASGRLRARWTLAIDEALSFGGPAAAPPTTPVDRVAAAMREEPLPADSPDGDVASAIDDAATLQERYRAMLATLSSGGRVVRLGRDAPVALERDFASVGLKVVGPSVDQLLLCAEAVDGARQVASLRASRAASRDAAAGEVDLYRAVSGGAGDGGGGADGSGSAAVNCQSVILRLSGGGVSAVFLGDMQFADPQVGGLRKPMAGLLLGLRSAGPFDFARLPHHGAANGTDVGLLEAIGPDAAYGVSGGASGSHPARPVLALLAGSARSGWTRTDLNGAVVWTAGTGGAWRVARGQVSDASPPQAPERPRRARRGSRSGGAEGGVGIDGPLGAGRPLPKLLFLTDSAALERRVGSAAAEALELIRAGRQQVLDVRDGPASVGLIRDAAAGCDGVVIVGGHEVLPHWTLDALPAGVRRSLSRGDGDPDGHVVWSDDPYVSLDGGGPDLPVSRVPDGGDGELLLAALRTRPLPVDRAFGLRNADRPFAQRLFGSMAHGAAMQVAEPARSGSYGGMVAGETYLMLHCSHEDCGRYWGSDDRQDSFLVGDVPHDFAGSVFAGCCYGALTVDGPAVDGPVGVRSLDSGSSIALRFLRAGARAFVGATGVHYSPLLPPWDRAAGPLHEAFLRASAAGVAPARALFDAKLDYINSLRIDAEPGESAIALKTWRQFSCLGLGW